MPVDRTAFITTEPLQNVAFDYFLSDEELVAKKICTVVPFDKADKKVSQVDASKLRLLDDEKGTSSEPNLADEQIFSRSITAKEYKLAADINPRDVRDADVPGLLDEGRQTKVVTQRLMLQAEKRFADLAMTSSNYMTSLTSALSSGSKWNEAGGSPEGDKITVNDALRNTCGRGANALLLEWTTLQKLRLSPEWRSRTQYTNGGPIPDALIKAFFEVEHLFVGSARYNSAVQGATASMTKMFGDDAVFFVHDPSTSMEAQNSFLMAMVNSAFWVDVQIDPKKRGSAGYMKRVSVGTEYVFTPGMVESTSSSKLASAYLLRDVVA